MFAARLPDPLPAVDAELLFRLAAIVEASPAVSYALEPKGRRATFRSANAAAHFGWTTPPGRSPHDRWLEAVHPADLEPTERRLTEWLAEGAEGVLRRSYRIRHGNGQELWVDDHLRAVRDGAGRVVELVGIMEDATEQDGRNRRLDALVRNVPGMIYQLLLRPDGSASYPYVSSGIREIFGVEPGDVRDDASAVFERIHPDDVGEVQAVIRAASETLTTPRTRYRVRHPVRGEIWVQGRSTPERLADGAVLFNGYITDITDEELAKAELERTRDQLESFFDVSLDLLCIATLDGHFVRVNRAWTTVLGYPVEALDGARFLDFVHPDDVAGTLDVMRILASGQPSPAFVNRYRCTDGAYRLIEWRSQPHGDLIYAAARDVTEREATVRAMEESRRKLAALFQLAPMGIALNRLGDGRFLEVNPALERISGRSRDELLAGCFNDVVMRDPSVGSEETVRAHLLKHGRYGPIERRLVRKDGSEATVSLNGVVLDGTAEDALIWSILEDVTARKRSEAELVASRQRLSDFARSSADWFWEADAELRLTWFSSSFAELGEALGMAPLGQRLQDLDTGRGDVAALERARHDGAPIHDLGLHLATGERPRWFVVNALPIVVDGVLRGYRGTGTDITERKEAELALEASRQELGSLYRLAPIGIALCGLDDGRFVEVNPELERITGYGRAELCALRFHDLLPHEEGIGVEPMIMAELRTKGRFGSFERRLVRKDGSEATVLVDGVVIEAVDGRRQVWSIVQDITAQKTSQLALKALAEQDALTGLVNRKVMTERLRCASAATGGCRAGAVVLLDLDHFKEVNDTLGHDAGDELLREIARRLVAAVAAEDLVARLGGDEFALILHGDGGGLDRADAEARVRAAVEALQRPLRLGQRVVRPRASVGVAVWPGDGCHPSELLKHADIALYRSKALGRNTWTFFDRSMRDDLERRTSIADALRLAIGQDRMALALQAQHAVAEPRHAGFEALVRWENQGRLMLPGAFVPIAEETGLIVPLGRAVMRQAFAHLRHMLDLGLEPGWMAINVAAAQLKEASFVTELANLLQAHRIEPRRIELEITEGVLLDRAGERIAETLAAVHRLGVSIALDDFGTGYASLKHLNRFPVDRLKIDQSFVRDIGSDPQDAAIARAVINLAHSLGMDVVAEGVETAEQLAFLRLHGCDFAQGYLLGRPVPLAAAVAGLRARDPVPADAAAG